MDDKKSSTGKKLKDEKDAAIGSENIDLSGSASTPVIVSHTEDKPTAIKHEKKYKSRLILGDGNFSYTKGVIEKHKDDKPGLASAITTTEYDTREKLCESATTPENLEYIEDKGGTTKFGVDARYLETSFPDTKFKRIQFNCPFVNNGSNTQNMVHGFFESAKNLQNNKDRVQMALVDPPGNRTYYHGRTYGIIDASASSGYEVIKKRKFGAERYPGYTHRSTSGNSSSPFAQHAKEFIFEKTDKTADEIIKKGEEAQLIKGSKGNRYYDIPTDDDSSSYEDSLEGLTEKIEDIDLSDEQNDEVVTGNDGTTATTASSAASFPKKVDAKLAAIVGTTGGNVISSSTRKEKESEKTSEKTDKEKKQPSASLSPGNKKM